MPTYEYECDACEHRFEEFQSINDKPMKKCPECGKSKLRRLFGTGAAIIFKGSGFYQTDYRSDSYKASAKADQDSSSKPADKPSADSTTGTTGANGSTSQDSSGSVKAKSKKSSKSKD